MTQEIARIETDKNGTQKAKWNHNLRSPAEWLRIIRYKIALFFLPQDYKDVIFQYNKDVFRYMIDFQQKNSEGDIIH